MSNTKLVECIHNITNVHTKNGWASFVTGKKNQKVAVKMTENTDWGNSSDPEIQRERGRQQSRMKTLTCC